MVLMAMQLLLALSSLTAALGILFLAPDLPYLRSTPQKSTRIFFWKTVQTCLASSGLVLSFTLPILWAWSRFFAPSPLQMACTLLSFLAFLSTGALLGILLSLLVPLLVSIRRIQPVLTVLSILLISAAVVALRLLRPERFMQPGVVENLMVFFQNWQAPELDALPFSVLARSLSAIALKNPSNLLIPGLYFGFLLSALIGVLFLFARYAYRPLLEKVSVGSQVTFRPVWSFRPSLQRLLAVKELRTFRRSPEQWSQLLVIAAIMGVFVLNLQGLPLVGTLYQRLVTYPP